MERARLVYRLGMNVVLCLINPWVSFADDWPGLLGPFRTGHSASENTLPTEGIAAELSTKWELPAGQGYAGLAVVNGKAVLFDRSGDQDRVRYVDSMKGTVLWEKLLPANYRGGVDADKGPRCVPTLADQSMVLYSAAGELSALSKVDGRVLWTRSLSNEFGADLGYFGAGSTPLVFDDRIVINVGGKRAGVLCVSLSEGKDLWVATNYDASYASPILWKSSSAETNAFPTQVVVPTRLKTIGIEASSGRVLWETLFGQRGPTVNGATPIPCGLGHLFLTASYGIGNIVLKPSELNVKVVHQGEQMNSQYATPVDVDGWIYGSDGREDMGRSSYKCLNSMTGEIAWDQTEMPICHTIVVNSSQLLLIGIDGRVWLLNVSEKYFSVIWKSRLAPGIYRALPALADNHLFVRSNSGDNRWSAFEISATLRN